jgi:TP901 family phage tail tape measure protein
MSDRTVKVSLVAQVNNYLSGMEQARKATEGAGKSAEDAAKKYAEQNQAMTSVGTGLVAAGAVAVAATALAVKAAIDWETAWAGVTKTVEGTPAQLAEMEAGLRGLAKELPATHAELAAVAEAAGQLGVKREGVLAFTKTMVDLANTTNLTADEAATSIAQLMNVMQTAPDDVDNLGAALVALGNNGASTERDIIQMAQRIAGAGKVVGLTEAEVLGFANALASVGIEAEAGGSAISRIMTDMAMAVSAGGADLENFAKVAGMSGQDFAVAFKDAPAEAIATFVEGLGGINAAGGDVFKTLADLGQSDIRTSQALLGMANSGDMLRESLDLGSKAWDENTALAAEAEKRYETTASKLQVMANNVNDAAISFGDVFLPAVQGAAAAVGALAEGFGALPQPVQAVVAVTVALAAATALGGGAFLLAIPKIAEYRAALLVLSTSSIPAVAAATTGLMTATTKAGAGLAATAKFLTGPWGVALAAAGVGVKLLSDYIDSLKTSTESWQNVIKNADSSKTLFAAADQGRLVSQLDQAVSSAEDFQHSLDLIANNDFARGFSLSATQLKTSLADIGEQLAATAESDLPSAQQAFALLAEQTDGSKKQLGELLSTMPAFEEALVAQANALDVDITNMSEAERKTALLEIAQGKGATVTETAADAYKAAADEAASLSDQLTELVDMINEANGVGQDAVSSNATWLESLDGITASVDAQKEAFIKLQEDAWLKSHETLDGFKGTLDGFTLSLDQSTASGSANASMLSDVAADAQAAAAAQYEVDKKTMGAKDATDKYVTTLATNKTALENAAIAAGFSADEVKKLSDAVYKTPSQKEINFLVDTAEAQTQVNNFMTLNSGKKIRIAIEGQTTTGGITKANGGIVDYYANGGMRENHVAQIAPAGAWRVWAEEETGGESYIPLAASKRARSLDIWRETGKRLGVAGYANGFVSPQYASASGAGVTSVSVNPEVRVTLSSKGGVDLLKYVDVRVEQAGNDRRRTAENGVR